MKKQREYLEIDVYKVFSALWKRVWAIILAAVLIGGCFCTFTIFCIQPLYTAETMLYVNNKSLSVGDTKVSISQGDLTAAQSLIETYGVILKSRTTLNEVIKQSGVEYTYKELVKMINSAAINGTEVFHVEVTSTTPEEAELLANTIARVLPEKIASIVDGSSVRIIDYAVIPSRKSSPSITMNTFLGGLLGAFLAGAVVVVKELRDDRIRDTDYILQNYELPILAVVPDLKGKVKGERYYYSSYEYGRKKKRSSPQSEKSKRRPEAAVPADRDILGDNLNFAAAETYKLLRTNLEFSTPDEERCQIFGLTSAMRGEGKTTTAINTAYTFAQTGKRVLLMEADLRLPNIARRLLIKKTPGLTNLLAKKSTSQGALQQCDLIEQMWVIPGGNPPPNPAELLGSRNMKQLLEDMSKRFDVILVDLPPVGIVSDALKVSRYLDGIAVIVRQNMCTQKALAEVIRKLDYVHAKVLGFVVTGSNVTKKKNYRYRKSGHSNYGDYDYDYESSYESAAK